MVRVDTELLGLQIVALNDASVVGEVDGLIIDDRAMKVAGFLVDLGLFEASVLPFHKASAVGADAIIVADSDTLAPITADADLDTLATKDITISDARVITRSGKTVGSVGDFFVDTDSGDVVGMEFIADDQSVYPKDVAVLPSAAVVRLGRDIVVVSDDYLQRLQRDAGSLDRLTRDDPVPALPPETALQPAPEPEAAAQAELTPQPEAAPEFEAPAVAQAAPEFEAPPEPEAPAGADEPAVAEADEPSPSTEPDSAGGHPAHRPHRGRRGGRGPDRCGRGRHSGRGRRTGRARAGGRPRGAATALLDRQACPASHRRRRRRTDRRRRRHRHPRDDPEGEEQRPTADPLPERGVGPPRRDLSDDQARRRTTSLWRAICAPQREGC